MTILTVAEVAEKTGKSQKTVRRAIAAGYLKATSIQNKLRIEETDCDDWAGRGCPGKLKADSDYYVVMSASKVAELSRRSEQTVLAAIRSGNLKAEKREGKYQITEYDYLDWEKHGYAGKSASDTILSPDMLSTRKVAQMSGMSTDAVRRAILKGGLIASKINNRYYVAKDDFIKWSGHEGIFIEESTVMFREPLRITRGELNLEAVTRVSNRNKSSRLSEGFTSVDERNRKVKESEFQKDPWKKNHVPDKVNWVSISDLWSVDGWARESDRTEYRFIDLFSGAGGLSCGLVMAGFKPIASVEIMDAAVATYKRNFIDYKGFNETVETRDIRKKEIKDELYRSFHHEHIDLIVGGFPCQGFSLSGYRVEDDPRNSLYREMKDIVADLRPAVVVMENVEGLRSMLNGKVEEKIIEDYKEIGYDINLTVLNSAYYEVPQTRKRVIFIGNRIGVKNLHPEPIIKDGMYKTLGEAIEKYMDMPDDRSINHVRSRHSPEMEERLAAVPEGKSLYPGYSDAWKKSPWDKPSCTIKENHGATNIHPKRPRCLTARECAALQSFPDDFIFEGSKKWQLVQIGNAVPPLLGKAIGLAVRKMLDGVKKDKPAPEEIPADSS